ncbi:MAG: hypothetical protein ABS54_10075 [Hyphomicrobium sp. SCN 65-11]|nr:MAG: hypothetical protein ABS54_10075 [Hyphomicrobium sp. SCN 65-11]
MTVAQEHDDLSYRPAPMGLSPSERKTVSARLQKLLAKREELRTNFVHLDMACDDENADKATASYAKLNRKRDSALSKLCDVQDDVLLYDPQSIEDLRIVIAMARHQIEAMELHEDFVELLLSHVERLILPSK